MSQKKYLIFKPKIRRYFYVSIYIEIYGDNYVIDVFLGSIGIGTNDPVTINITDSEDNAVVDAMVYYQQQKKPYGYNYANTVYIPIGTTDENGNVQWEDQEYGE